MKYEIPVQNHQSAKITTINKYQPITELRALLSTNQLSDFSKSCFGHFLNMPHFKIQHQLIHNLLIRQLKQPNPNELWIGLGGMIMKFGLEEFATVTGLLCVGTFDKKRFSKSENSFVSTYYEGNNSVSKGSVKNTFYCKEWKTDSDAVKIAKLYFLHHFLLTSSTDCQIPKGDLDLLDSEEFDKYPWGKEVFKLTMDSLKHNANTRSKDNYYRLTGFPYALQVWFYECCPYMNGKYCDRIGGSIPHILNWTSEYTAKFGEVYTTMSLAAKDLQLKNFSRSANELEELQLKELFVKSSTLDAGCNEISTYVSDDDFVCPAPPRVTGVASSSISSKDEMSLNKMRSQMRKLEASQRNLEVEVKDLKCIVNDQRSFFDLELSKLRDILLKKVVIDNDDCNKVNSEPNDDAFLFDNVFVEEVSPRVGEDKVHSPNVVENCATDVATVVNDQECENGQILTDDFSPETTEKLEDIMKKVDEDSNQKKIDLYKSENVVLCNVGGSGTSGLGKVTPSIPKRSIKLPAYLRSPFLQHFGSSSKETIDPTNVHCFKGICPLDNNIGNLPDMDLSSEYYSWLDKGLLMNKNKRKFYSKEDNDISPPIKLGCEIISEKTWFHTIEYGSSNFSTSHVDVFFYYLRKLSKYSAECKMNFTTSDCKFQKAIASLYADISESDNIQSKITAKQGILDVLNGVTLPFSTPWYLVDKVLLPIWLAEKKHWVLAIVNFKERQIRVWNTLSCEGIALIVRNALLPLSTILPHYLLLTDFYSRTDINFSTKCYTDKSKTDCFRSIMQNDYVCGESIDSGVAMISIAQYLVFDKDFPKASFDVAVHRSRISFSFYAYGMAKQIYAYESEHEYFDDGRGDVVAKRTRAGRVQTRKRNLGNAYLKSKKGRKD